MTVCEKHNEEMRKVLLRHINPAGVKGATSGGTFEYGEICRKCKEEDFKKALEGL